MSLMPRTPAPSQRRKPLGNSTERGETVIIARGRRTVAEIRSAPRRTGAALRTALAGVPPPDESFAASIADALTVLPAAR
jgi:hypothetical protein